MSFFIGNIEAKLDAKGRAFLPSAYRKLLPENNRERIVMRIDPDNACLILFPEDVWNKKVLDLQSKLDEWNAEDQMLLMQFVSDAEWLDIDSQGRILIPKRYLQSIDANNEILFVGMIDRIAIWNKTNYENSKLNRNSFAKKLSEKMGSKNKEIPE